MWAASLAGRVSLPLAEAPRPMEEPSYPHTSPSLHSPNISSREMSAPGPSAQRAPRLMAHQPHAPQQLLGAPGHLKQEGFPRALNRLSQPRSTMDSA